MNDANYCALCTLINPYDWSLRTKCRVTITFGSAQQLNVTSDCGVFYALFYDNWSDTCDLSIDSINRMNRFYAAWTNIWHPPVTSSTATPFMQLQLCNCLLMQSAIVANWINELKKGERARNSAWSSAAAKRNRRLILSTCLCARWTTSISHNLLSTVTNDFSRSEAEISTESRGKIDFLLHDQRRSLLFVSNCSAGIVVSIDNNFASVLRGRGNNAAYCGIIVARAMIIHHRDLAKHDAYHAFLRHGLTIRMMVYLSSNPIAMRQLVIFCVMLEKNSYDSNDSFHFY